MTGEALPPLLSSQPIKPSGVLEISVILCILMELMIVCGHSVRRRAGGRSGPINSSSGAKEGGQRTLMTTGFAPDCETVYLPAP